MNEIADIIYQVRVLTSIEYTLLVTIPSETDKRKSSNNSASKSGSNERVLNNFSLYECDNHTDWEKVQLGRWRRGSRKFIDLSIQVIQTLGVLLDQKKDSLKLYAATGYSTHNVLHLYFIFRNLLHSVISVMIIANSINSIALLQEY